MTWILNINGAARVQNDWLKPMPLGCKHHKHIRCYLWQPFLQRDVYMETTADQCIWILTVIMQRLVEILVSGTRANIRYGKELNPPKIWEWFDGIQIMWWYIQVSLLLKSSYFPRIEFISWPNFFYSTMHWLTHFHTAESEIGKDSSQLSSRRRRQSLTM